MVSDRVRPGEPDVHCLQVLPAMFSMSEDNEQYLSTEEDDVDVDGEPKGLGDKKARAHHNYLERLRRDHIKESFKTLKQSLPSMGNERASRASILNSATGYINQLKKSNGARAVENDQIRHENEVLEQKLRDAGVPVPGTVCHGLPMRRAPVANAHMHGHPATTAHFSVPLEHQLGTGPVAHIPGASTLIPTSALQSYIPPMSSSNTSSSLRSRSPGSEDSDDSDGIDEPRSKRHRPTRRKHSV